MHGSRAFLVNAEVDSMDGVVEGGVGIATIASPQQVLIEKVQAELRQEFDVREERRRELEFLEKGGDPLDFKLGNKVSISVQSTSLTDQHPEQFVNSEAKSSFALTASPYGDSVESSGRPGVPPVCEPNSADNLMLFDGGNQTLEGEKTSFHRSRTKFSASEQSSPLATNHNAKELGGFAAFSLPKKAYRRRNRSRPNRDGARSSSTDVVLSHGGRVSSSNACHDPTDAKPVPSIVDNQKDQKISSNLKHTGSSDSTPPKNLPSDSQLYVELDGAQVLESTSGLTKGDLQNFISDANASENVQNNQHGRLQLDAQGTAIQMAFEAPESAVGREHVGLDSFRSPPCITTEVNNKATTSQMNGFSGEKGCREGLQSDGQIPYAPSSTKGLDSESSCTQTSHSLDCNNDNETFTDVKKLNMNGNAKESALVCEGTQNELGDTLAKEENETKADDSSAFLNDKSRCAYQSDLETGSVVKSHEGSGNHGSGWHEEKRDPITNGRMEPDGLSVLGADREPNNLSCHSYSQNDGAFKDELQGDVVSSVEQNSEATLSVKIPVAALQQGVCSDIHQKIPNKKHEESILEEARIIEAKQKRIAELSVGFSSVENCQKSQWHFVLEEMRWLANDFSQERVWKITTAVQLSHRVALTCRLRFEKQNSCRKQREVGHTLGKAVMEFWRSAFEKSKEVEVHFPEKNAVLGVLGYVIRFLKQNGSTVLDGQVEAPVTPDRTSDSGILDMPCEYNLTEENLFYTVPLGSMKMYRKSIESHLTECEKTGSSMQEEVETSAYDGVTEFGSHDNAYEEDEGETSMYYLPGTLEGSRSSKFAQKHKNPNKAYGARSYEMGADLPFVQCMENKVWTQQSFSLGKRPSGSLNVSIPRKRVRTTSRQRVLCPSAGTSGGILAPSKTDASSGDTSSFQDDHSTLHGGSQILNGLEVDSAREFEKQLAFNSGEVSKPKKKKKAKHLVSAYGQRWQLESNFQIEQRDHSKKRSENHQLESNGSSGLFGQHMMKKPKLTRQSLDNSFDNITSMNGSVPSPVASQMSNMPNPSKFIRMFGGQDRGRKGKSLKVPAGQAGFGCPWSIFEDQALVVLVHDMGPNWELVSDAISSTLPFKCVFRKPKECKERHKSLMDRSASDGTDSAQNSGSSQPYPSTLPGIPKGSARQLFQRLQGPMEEDTLKSNFEKIIMLWQRHHCLRAQNDNKDPKQLQQPHNSHTLALSQVSPNNLNGPILTPLNLCDATASSPDVLPFGYQGPHTSRLAVNQGSVAPMLPGSCTNSPEQGSNMIIGSNFSMSSVPFGASTRDGRYGVSQTASLSTEEQQRMQHYNQMLPGRNTQQSSLSVSGAFRGNDHGVGMLPVGNGMGIMGGVSRSMPIIRPGLQGVASSPMVNSGSMLSSGMLALPSPVNMHPGVGSTQGSSIIRPRDALQMTRIGQNQDPQRQILVSELPMQGSQGNNQAVPLFGGLTSSNQTVTPSVHSYPLHQQQPHPISPHRSHLLGNVHHSLLQGPNHVASTQHQAYAIRVAKERQRILQQQQFTASNALMPHVQPPSQLPLPPSTQPNSHIQSQTSSPVSLAPSTPSTSPLFQHQQKHQMPPHGLGRNAQAVGGGLNNQMGKQRQHQIQQQQFQQPGRQHPQQRQQSQSQQQAKLLKGVVRGNMVMNQNLPMDSSLNGLSANPGSKSAGKNKQVMHLVQGQGLNPVQQSSSIVPPHSSNQALPQQKMYSGQVPSSSNQLPQMLSHPSENGNQGVSPFDSGSLLPNSHQAVSPQVMASSNQQPMQAQSQQTSVNHGQHTVKRMVQQIRQVNSDLPSKLQAEESHSSLQISTTKAQPQTCIDVTNGVLAGSSACARWKELQPLNDSTTSTSAAHLSSTGTAPLKNPTVIEAATPVSHGLDQIQSSCCLSPIDHEIGAQWQQQSSQLQQPSTPLTSHKQQQQQTQSPQHQLPPLQQSQQQTTFFTS